MNSEEEEKMNGGQEMNAENEKMMGGQEMNAENEKMMGGQEENNDDDGMEGGRRRRRGSRRKMRGGQNNLLANKPMNGGAKKGSNNNNDNQDGGAKKIPAVGSHAQVWNGTCRHTSGGLTRKDLMKNKHGRIVSRKKHALGKKALKHLKKSGFVAKKGTFKLFRKK